MARAGTAISSAAAAAPPLLRRRSGASPLLLLLLLLLVVVFSDRTVASRDADLGSARVVFQTVYGDIEFGFFPGVAPKTVEHIFKLVRLGCYNTNHFFRVDRGFVAQVADVVGGRTAPMNEEQRAEAEKTVVGILIRIVPPLHSLYFLATHLTLMARVTKGDDTLRKLEELPTRQEGIFVMPLERITILSTYYYDTKVETCEREKTILKRRLYESAIEVERQRMKCLP
ncbi:Peptidyl-prolyl cis-trans isomerase CYP23 [Ananas comosus]|uniref:Peptidyl-prolyl cis-trans isomerase CYP23 n=1 Tax=Ananas comosus TaxID=4615 RepID=A0A199W7G3_ANACO|nr:Peptidyl-prolyl cis-trans isomerase CYP23 [Ananas comosus]